MFHAALLRALPTHRPLAAVNHHHAGRERLSYRMGEAVVQQWYLKVGTPRRRPQPIASRVHAAAVVQGT